MEPFFTVVIASLNQGNFLEEAICSLLAEQESDLEIIVVDGGSTDASVSIIEKYSQLLGGEQFTEKERKKSIENEKLRERLRTSFFWCSEPDRGQSHAFNKGFARASGRFLFWLNADDLLLPETLKRVRECIRKFDEKGRKIEWIAGNMIHINAQNEILWCARGEGWHDFLFRHAPVRVYGPSSFFSRALFERVGEVDNAFRVAMDKDLWLRLRNLGAQYVRVDSYFWGFRAHPNSKTRGAEYDRIPEHKAENLRVEERNNLRVTWYGLLLQRVWRLASGCYLFSAIDTWRFRGKKITDISV